MPKVFEEYGLSKYDFETIKSIFPSVSVLDEERMRKNIELVVYFGYPVEDISIFMVTNPSFLSYDPQRLKKKLEILTDGKTFNLENLLKCDPFII